MSSPELLAPVLGAVSLALAASDTPVVLIDGPSGAGKTTLADRLLDAWPSAAAPTLVRMDELYPGWGGLEAGSVQLRDELLLPRSRRQSARWQRYDWARQAPGDWLTVDAGHPLIVEGCGTLRRDDTALSDVRVWIGADDAVRKRRALDRDHGGFDAHWDEWQRQFEAFVASQDPVGVATLILDGTG